MPIQGFSIAEAQQMLSNNLPPSSPFQVGNPISGGAVILPSSQMAPIIAPPIPQSPQIPSTSPLSFAVSTPQFPQPVAP